MDWCADNTHMITTGQTTIKQTQPVEATQKDVSKVVERSASSKTTSKQESEPDSTTGTLEPGDDRANGPPIVGSIHQRKALGNSTQFDTQQKSLGNERKRYSNQPHEHLEKKKSSRDTHDSNLDSSTSNSDSADMYGPILKRHPTKEPPVLPRHKSEFSKYIKEKTEESVGNNMKLSIKDGKFNSVISMQGNFISRGPFSSSSDESVVSTGLDLRQNLETSRDLKSKCENEISAAKPQPRLSPLRIRINRNERSVSRLSSDSMESRDHGDGEKISYTLIKKSSANRDSVKVRSDIKHGRSKSSLEKHRPSPPMYMSSTSTKLEPTSSKTSQPSTRPVLSSTLSVNGQYSRSAADDPLVRERAWELVEQLTEQNEVKSNWKYICRRYF